MLFNSIQFMIFFPIVVLFYFAIPHRYRNIWLLLASYYFYICWNPKYALILATSTIITYLGGYLINWSNKQIPIMTGNETKQKKDTIELEIKYRVSQKKLWVALCFITNLSILFFFKYFDFAINNINNILSTLNMGIIQPEFEIILPVGISFYMFQALGYIIDVYRGDVPSEKNIFKYALFVSFFPQLISGPIGRAKNMLKQFEEKHFFNYERTKSGLLMMLWGFFLKMVIADRVAILVNQVYGEYETFSGVQILLATFFYTIQIYCDFSSYSNIAIGAAEVMGFQLMENFNTPYFAISVSDFWRRWHISLSSWFKDYLYIPLGGNRKGKVRKYINILIVFFTSGLWHGASWNFVIWGGLNGIYQIIGAELMPARNFIVSKFKVNRDAFSHIIYKIIFTFILTNFTWIFFRAQSLSDAVAIIRRIFTEFNPSVLFDGKIFEMGLDVKDYFVLFIAAFILFIVSLCKYNNIHLRTMLNAQGLWLRWIVYLALIFYIIIFGIYGSQYDASQFIYFQF